MTIFDLPISLVLGLLLLGLINGAFYALISLGLAVIFGMLNIINFTHGAFFMMGAFLSWMLLEYLGLGYWWALALAPLITAGFGIAIERLLIRRLYDLNHLYGLLLTYGLALMIEASFRNAYGSAGLPYQIPGELTGVTNLGFMIMPNYRIWVLIAALVVCVVAWLLIERTALGAKLRAATSNPEMVQALGINVPRMITLTYAAGVALAALAGALAAPIYSVNPGMGEKFVVIGFAIVVIGGMGSIMGSIVIGTSLGLIEALTNIVYPPASSVVVFLVMIAVLLAKPAGLFGRET